MLCVDVLKNNAAAQRKSGKSNLPNTSNDGSSRKNILPEFGEVSNVD